MKRQKERSPSMQFYFRQFSGDEHVQSMDLDTVGAHILLMCAAGAAPERYRVLNNPDKIRRLLGQVPGETWDRIWSQLLEGAWKISEDGKWIEQLGMFNALKKQKEFSRLQTERASKRWDAERIPNGCQINANIMPDACSSSSSSSSSSSTSSNIYIKEGTPTSSEPLFPSNEIKPSLAKPTKDPKPKDPPGFRDGSRAFGPYKRVYLTELEYSELCQKFGTDPVHRKITSLDADLENRVTKYIKFKNHAACLRKWFAMDADKPRRSNYGNDLYTNR